MWDIEWMEVGELLSLKLDQKFPKSEYENIEFDCNCWVRFLLIKHFFTRTQFFFFKIWTIVEFLSTFKAILSSSSFLSITYEREKLQHCLRHSFKSYKVKTIFSNHPATPKTLICLSQRGKNRYLLWLDKMFKLIIILCNFVCFLIRFCHACHGRYMVTCVVDMP